MTNAERIQQQLDRIPDIAENADLRAMIQLRLTKALRDERLAPDALDAKLDAIDARIDALESRIDALESI